MGIYDRDYQRGSQYDDSPGFHIGAPQTMTIRLVLVTAAVYLAQLLSDDWVTETFALKDEWFRQPWQAFQLLSYGFLHDPEDIANILFNMFGLWLFGREIEQKYGQREFLTFYLTAIVLAGIVWSLAEIPMDAIATMVGASGGVSAVVILFAMNYPHRTVLFLFVIPMPMWVLGLLFVGLDIFGAMDRSGNVASTAHLGGALFGFLYYMFGWRLVRWLPSTDWTRRLRPRPKLRVHFPEGEGDSETTDSAVDEILKKIQEHGQASLTRRERKTLEQASLKYQKRRK